MILGQMIATPKFIFIFASYDMCLRAKVNTVNYKSSKITIQIQENDVIFHDSAITTVTRNLIIECGLLNFEAMHDFIL